MDDVRCERCGAVGAPSALYCQQCGAPLATADAATVVLAALLPVALVVAWGWLIAPKSTRRLPDPQRLVLEIAIFIATGTALAISGYPIPAILLTVASIVVAAALRLTDSHV